MSFHRVILGVVLVFVPFVARAGAPSANISARFTAIQAQLNALNKRLRRLERILPQHSSPSDAIVATAAGAATAPPSAAPPRVRPEPTAYRKPEKLRASWKKLQRGLSRTKLRQLLGKPRSKLVLGRQTLWYYRYPGIGGGSVILDNDGKVTGWQEPPFRGW